jgi:hypothetical protein
VPAGPDAAVLEFAVALAHHHDAITGVRGCQDCVLVCVRVRDGRGKSLHVCLGTC